MADHTIQRSAPRAPSTADPSKANAKMHIFKQQFATRTLPAAEETPEDTMRTLKRGISKYAQLAADVMADLNYELG